MSLLLEQESLYQSMALIREASLTTRHRSPTLPQQMLVIASQAMEVKAAAQRLLALAYSSRQL